MAATPGAGGGFPPIAGVTLAGVLGRKWQGWTLTVEQASDNLGELGRALVLLAKHKLSEPLEVSEARGMGKFALKRVTITGTLKGKEHWPSDGTVAYDLFLEPAEIKLFKPPKEKKRKEPGEPRVKRQEPRKG